MRKEEKRTVDELKSKGKHTDKSCFCCGEKRHTKNVCKHRLLECKHCHQTGHTLETCWRRKVICFCCGERGHIKKNCRYRQEKCPTCNMVGHRNATCRRRHKKPKNGLNSESKPFLHNHIRNLSDRSRETRDPMTFLKYDKMSNREVHTLGKKPIWDISGSYVSKISPLIVPRVGDYSRITRMASLKEVFDESEN